MIKSMRMSWVRHMACVGEKRNAYRILVGKPEGKGLTKLAKFDVTQELT
jgi:hypothetical protein